MAQKLKTGLFIRLIITYFVLFPFINVYSQDTIITSGSEWKYFDKGTIDIENILLQNFNELQWSVGRTPIGFGQDDEATVINFTNELDSVVTFFVFQKKILLHNINDYKTFLIRLVRDDGAIVYINGKEVARSNLPDGILSAKTKASTLINGVFEYKFYEYFVSPSYFKSNENIISVILFQFHHNSSDCRFDMELLGYENYEVLNQLIHNINSERKLLENELELYTVERMLNEKTDEIKFLNLEYSINKNFFLVIIGLLVISIILMTVFLVWTWKKSYKLLLKQRLLEKETEGKSRELINLSLSILKVKQFISSLMDDLQGVHRKANKEQQVHIVKLLNRIEFHRQFEEDWERLKMHFDTIHSCFFARLKNKYPELTQYELRHCTYIKLQMFTSEIAQLLNIEHKSVQANRYRIKKKMQLPTDVDLKTYLEDF